MKLRYWSLSCFVWLILPNLFSSYTVAAEDEKIAWIEGRFFDVIGTDNRSVSFANGLGEHIAELSQRYLKAGSHDFPKRILVTLYPKERFDFKGNYRIQISSRGQVSLDFCWDESLSFELACLAVTEAYLMNYARYNYGVDADTRVCFWAFSTLFSRNYLNLRPAQKTNLIRIARESEMLEIKSLLSMSLSEAKDKKLDLHQGYWVFQALDESGLTRSQLSELLDWAIAGIDVTNQIVKQVFSEANERSVVFLEEWWRNQMGDYLSQDHEFCDTLMISRSWITEMVSFDSYRSSGGKLKDLMELWTYRDDESLRSVLSARCEIIRLRIEQVNPAYFNAALSLGALYETVLEAENKHEFISAVLFFLNDWEDTKRLHLRVDELTLECD